MIRKLNSFALAAVVASVLLHGTAQAQVEDSYDAGGDGYRDAGSVADGSGRVARLQARNDTLRGELVRYRSLYEGALADGGGCDQGCCLQPATWFDPCCWGPTVAFSVNGDAWRDNGDVESVVRAENNFGNRFSLDTTWNVADGVQGHLGAGYGLFNYHGRLGSEFENASSAEQQIFLSAGLYHRASGCCGDNWSWAASYDFLNDNRYGDFAESIDLHQVRLLVGRMMNPCNEFGVWAAFGIGDDDYGIMGQDRVDVQDQVNLYWRRYWDFGGETMLYTGLAQRNFFPSFFEKQRMYDVADDNDLTEVVIGLRGIAPLTCNVGLVGGFHYVIPSASGGVTGGTIQSPIRYAASTEENWNVTFGIVWVRGCSLPLLPTADNGWLSKRSSRILD